MRYLSVLLTLIVMLLPAVSKAQFYRVYGYETMEQGEIEVVMWNSAVVQSDGTLSYFGNEVSRDGLWAHSLEVEYGMTDRLTLAVRADFMDPRGGAFKFVRVRSVFLRYRFGESGEYFFDPAIFLEYSLPRASFEEAEELEMRIILERELSEEFVLRLNPVFKMATSGHEVQEGLEFEYAGGIYYQGYHKVQPGLEIYGEAGELSRLEPFNHQGIVLFPTLDIHLGEFHWHIGAGFGLTDESDDVTIKSILSYGF